MITEIESVRSYLAYGAIALLFNFIYGMAVIMGYLAIDTRRQIKEKTDWCGGIKCGPSSWFFCCGKVRNFDNMLRPSRSVFYAPANKTTTKILPQESDRGEDPADLSQHTIKTEQRADK